MTKQSKEAIGTDKRFEGMSIREILESINGPAKEMEPGTIRVRIPLNDPEPLDVDLK